MSLCSKYVFLDNVPFRKNYFQNRNKIKGPNGDFWLTVPIKKYPNGTLIKDIEIDNSNFWKGKYLKSIIASYKNAHFFNKYFNSFEKIILKEYDKLIDLNIEIIKYFMSELGIKLDIIKASTLDVCGSKSELLLDICKKMKADIYLSGPSGKDYLDIDLFKKNNIDVKFNEFKHPIYKQMWREFIPNLSILDLLFNEGEWK